MENTMSDEANALLQKLLVSRIDAAGVHCGRAPDDEPERDEPEPDDE
jgi:hypothetical protein